MAKIRGVFKRGRVWWIRYAGLDGRTHCESSRSEKQSTAAELYRQRKAAVDEGREPETRKIGAHTLGELAEQYLSWTTGRQRSAGIKKYIVEELIQHFGGGLPLRRITPGLVEQYQSACIAKGLKPATINKKIAVLKHMLTKAADDWYLVEPEVLKRIRRVKPLKGEVKRLRYLSVSECVKLLSCCDAHLYPIVATALNTGMRKEEILSLTWESVDLRHGFILLAVTKNDERREVPINKTLGAIFQGMARRLDVPWVFHDPKTGKRYQNVKRSFGTACRRAGITDLHFHDLRHTFASQLVMSGVDITTVKELLGHKSLTMTLRYAHLAPAHKVRAVDILDETLTDSTRQKTRQSGL